MSVGLAYYLRIVLPRQILLEINQQVHIGFM